MLRHQNVAHDAETKLGAQVPKRRDEILLEALRVEKPGAAISAGGQEVQMIQTIIVQWPGHEAILHPSALTLRRHQTAMSDAMKGAARFE